MENITLESPIEYSKQYVAFIDILGFSKLTLKECRESKVHLNKCIDSIYSSVRAFKVSRIKVIFISDSLILSIHDMEEISSLVPLCQVVDGIQNNLLRMGLLSRGAISYGDAQIIPEEFRVFGPAYVQAVELEKNMAVFPRVIIDPNIMSGKTRGEILRSTVLEPGTAYQRNLLVSSEDQVSRLDFLRPDHFLFVDYLLAPFRRKDIKAINGLYLFIQKNLAISEPWLEKYQWMKDYAITSLRRCYDLDPSFYKELLDKFIDL